MLGLYFHSKQQLQEFGGESGDSLYFQLILCKEYRITGSLKLEKTTKISQPSAHLQPSLHQE